MKKISMFLALILFSSFGVAMSFLSKSEGVEVVLFSAMSGTLTFNGELAVGASLERRVKWDDGGGIVETLEIGEDGFFSFELLTANLELNPLNKLVVNQDIVATYRNEEYDIWIMGKTDHTKDTEVGGKPINFRCELTDPIARVETSSGLLGTICKWDGVE